MAAALRLRICARLAELHAQNAEGCNLDLLMPGDLPPENADLIEAHISAQQFQQLDLQTGEILVLTPRKARVFVA